MRINKQGISFSYYGDTLTWLWGKGYSSALYEGIFSDRNHYWQHIGAVEERSRTKGNLVGASWHNIITFWVKSRFLYETVVVVWDIQYNTKDKAFWRSLPRKSVEAFLEDVVVFRCKDLNQADQIRNSIEIDGLGICKVYVKGVEDDPV